MVPSQGFSQPEPYSIRLSRQVLPISHNSGAVSGSSVGGSFGMSYPADFASMVPRFPRESCEVGYSIDWLEVREDFSALPVPLPDFGSSQVFEFSCDSGEVTRRFLKSAQVEGSWSSSLQVRCSGGVVSVTGNPSRWGQRTSLEGLPSLVSALSVFSEVVRRVIPAFPGFSLSAVHLSRVDICRSYSLGSPGDARAFIHAAAGCLWGQRSRPRLYSDSSLGWGAGTPHYVKLYAKGPQLRDLSRKGPVADRVDLSDVCSWCDSQGVVRHEVQLRRKALVSFGLDRVSAWSAAAMAKVLSEDSAPFSRLEAPASAYGDARAKFLAAGFSTRRVAWLMGAIAEWRDGRDPRASRSVRQFYSDRKDCLAVLNLDLKVPCKVVAFPVQVRTLTLRPLVLPARFRRTV